MNAFIALAKEKGMADLASTVCATGGGAYKFEPDFKREVNMNLNKFDEIDSLIRGVEFIVENSNFNELFYYDKPQVSCGTYTVCCRLLDYLFSNTSAEFINS